jgi:hypothetical protein
MFSLTTHDGLAALEAYLLVETRSCSQGMVAALEKERTAGQAVARNDMAPGKDRSHAAIVDEKRA